jgi:hypothetical protein
MSLSVWFWVVYAVAVLFGFYSNYDTTKRFWFGGTLVNAVLFFILGLAAFGSPVKGH